MAPRAVTPRFAAIANLLFPGTGYLLLGRRVLLGGFLVGYTMITVALAIQYLATLFAHYAHVAPDGLPSIVGIIVLFAFQHAAIAVGVAWDAFHEASGPGAAAAAPGAARSL